VITYDDSAINGNTIDCNRDNVMSSIPVNDGTRIDDAVNPIELTGRNDATPIAAVDAFAISAAVDPIPLADRATIPLDCNACHHGDDNGVTGDAILDTDDGAVRLFCNAITNGLNLLAFRSRI
jgi:hypothetical protein